MQTVRLFGSLAMFSLSGQAFAHGDHVPPPQVATCKSDCTKVEVSEGAKKFMPTLVKENGLDTSWKDAALTGAEQKVFGKRTEWVVTFDNPKVADQSKQTIYMFVTMKGLLAGSNFTGK